MRDRMRILKKRTVRNNILRMASFFLVLIIVISVFVYNNAKTILLRELEENSLSITMNYASQIDDYIISMKKMMAALCSDGMINFYVESPSSAPAVFSNLHSSIQTQIQTLSYSLDSVYSIYVVSMRDRSYIDGDGYNPLDSLTDTSWMDADIDYSTPITIMPRSVRNIYPFVLTFIKKLGSGDHEGYVVLNMDIKKIPVLKNLNRSDDQIFIVTDGQEVLYRRMKRSLYEPIDAFPALVYFDAGAAEKSVIVERSERPFSFVQIHSDHYNWSYVTVINLHQYLRSLSAQRIALASFAGILMLVFVLVAVIVVLSAYRPIQRVLDVIENPGDWMTAEKHTSAEVKQIAEQIVRYVQTNTALSDELQRQLNVLNDVRLWAMQSQINPHFIFNTLNLIHAECVKQLGYKNHISTIIIAFSRLIRYALRAETLVPFSDEITHARLFLDILHDKYGDDFQSSVDIPDVFQGVMVPKLLLQPVIENAVEHGADFDGKGPLRVALSASLSESENGRNVSIVIWDNGVGMSGEQVAALRRSLAACDDMGEEKIGLRNDAARLRLLYGDEAGFEIESVWGEGTAVTIVLPA